MTRALVIIVLMVAACRTDESSSAADLASVVDLAPLCGPVIVPTTPVVCSGVTCAPGQICLNGPGGTPTDMAVADGGVAFMPSHCITPPAECQVCGACISKGGTQVALPTGCFATLCTGFISCDYVRGTLYCE